MAVIKAKPQKVVDSFVPLVKHSLIAPRVITRVAGDMFDNTKSDTVILEVKDLRAKAREYEFRTRTAPIQFDDISGGQELAIKIDTHVYSATGLTDEHMTLDDVDFVDEVLNPQVSAVALTFEQRVVAGLRAVDAKSEISIDAGADPFLVVAEAKRRMDSWKVAPRENRVVLVGDNVAAAWVTSDRLSKYESTGETGTPALRRAILGTIAGEVVLHVPELGPNEAFYHHKSSLVLGNVAPVIPRGVTAGASTTKNDFGFRWIADYDSNFLRDRSIVSSFLGMNEIKDERWLSDGRHDPDTGAVVSSGGVEHREGEIKPDVVAKNVRIVPITLTGFDSEDGLLA